jgi:hypothetical protein
MSLACDPPGAASSSYPGQAWRPVYYTDELVPMPKLPDVGSPFAAIKRQLARSELTEVEGRSHRTMLRIAHRG